MFRSLFPGLLASLLGMYCSTVPAGDCEGKASYELLRVIEVEGRQGVATDGESYFVSGNASLYRYSKTGDLLDKNEDALAGLPLQANHIGDISVYRGEIYAGIEWFEDGEGRNIQVAIFDAGDLSYKRSVHWEPESGQVEVSAVAVDPRRSSIWLTDWVNGRYLYRYDLETGAYSGKLHLRAPPTWQQGIGVRGDCLYVTADDGDAEEQEADNLWRIPANTGNSAAYVTHEHAFHEFRQAGEIEGIAFDEANSEMIVLANRGKRIILGMPRGLYPGYDREIHELYVYRVRD